MYLKSLIEQNKPLVEYGFWLHQSGKILPDTYLLDYDSIMDNARMMKAAADQNNVVLNFMLKQMGRNPEIGKGLMEIGFNGAVTVDFKEALVMIRHGIPLGNVGHLVQIPKYALKKIVAAKPEIITIYSIEKAMEINQVCQELGQKQEIMLRVIGSEDLIYPGQSGGFLLEELGMIIKKLELLPNLIISGVCSFPCFLYDEEKNDIVKTRNLDTVLTAARYLRERGFEIKQVNTPSANCLRSIPLINQYGGTHGEPGHGLTGTTPYHKHHPNDQEKPAILYLSEISHNLGNKSYCYGGGHYRRGNLEEALVGKNIQQSGICPVGKLNLENIDYHFELQGNHRISDTVIMCFRTQIFTTRSNVAVIKGLSQGNPRVAGIYSATGERLEDAYEP